MHVRLFHTMISNSRGKSDIFSPPQVGTRGMMDTLYGRFRERFLAHLSRPFLETEDGGLCTHAQLEHASGRFALIGLPVPGVDLRITDEEGRPRQRGEAGVLEVRTAEIFAGYWRRPEETRCRSTCCGSGTRTCSSRGRERRWRGGGPIGLSSSRRSGPSGVSGSIADEAPRRISPRRMGPGEPPWQDRTGISALRPPGRADHREERGTQECLSHG
jgi:hypothetical protein